jgi:hypothetical protein
MSGANLFTAETPRTPPSRWHDGCADKRPEAL